jgi:hypothetical protein
MSGSCPGNASWEAKPAAGCANISLIFCAGLALDAPLEQDIQAAGATHTKDCFGPATSRLLRKSVGVVRWFCGFSAFLRQQEMVFLPGIAMRRGRDPRDGLAECCRAARWIGLD